MFVSRDRTWSRQGRQGYHLVSEAFRPRVDAEPGHLDDPLDPRGRTGTTARPTGPGTGRARRQAVVADFFPKARQWPTLPRPGAWWATAEGTRNMVIVRVVVKHG